MKTRIVSKSENPLLKRKEVHFEVESTELEATPPRLEVRRVLATNLKVLEELVFIKRMKTMTGRKVTVGAANVYENSVQAKLVEPEFIIQRNTPLEKPKEEKEQNAGK